MKHIFALTGCLIFAMPLAIAKEETPASAAQASAAPPTQGKVFSGTVVETMGAGSYTYVLVDDGTRKTWFAAPEFEVKVGDKVVVPDGMPMRNYHSKTLNRDFDLVYFSGVVEVNGIQAGAGSAAGGLPEGHPPLAGGQAGALPERHPPIPGDQAGKLPKGHPPVVGGKAKPVVDLSGIKKADGGKTVQEIFAGRAKLKGKPVSVRGRVVKYNPMIMGKNWLHIRDGTGGEGSNDLVVTTSSEVKVGDTVLVQGVVSADKDFGFGYRYPVMIDGAKVTVE